VRAAAKAAIALTALAALLGPGAQAACAEAKPAWRLSATALPTNFTAGSKGTVFGGPAYLLIATNVGGAPTAGTVTLTDTLPTGLSAISAGSCEKAGQTITCKKTNPIGPGQEMQVRVVLEVSPLASASLLNEVSVTGGGAVPASITTTSAVSPTSAPFGFLPGFGAPLTQEDGLASTLAGSHPYQLTANLGFPTLKTSVGLGAAGHLRDSSVDFPPGEIVDPAASPVLCTEEELSNEGELGCPDASQVGTVDVITVPVAGPETYTSPLYNMVPPPGTAAELGFDAIGVGVFVHFSGSVRSDGDYGITGGTTDALALTPHPVFGAQVQLWGDPSAKSHDEVRGQCLRSPGKCPVEPQKTALLTTPGHCSGEPLTTVGHADSWEAPGVFEKAEYQSAALDGTPVSLDGCNELAFEPSIESKPTTNLTDSPSGLEFDLHQTQDTDKEGRFPAALKDATVTLPEGLVVNPSSANGQQACSVAQIGMLTAVGQAPAHFSKSPPSCPDASKVGTLEATTPLLAQIDPATHEVLRDPEGNAIPRPVRGSVYLAEPFQNPFNSLLAIYLSVEDPQSGTFAKLAGLVHADPLTGQLSTQVSESPQLPLEDVRIHLFNGARASLRTPSACGTYATTSDLTPWSSPEGLDEHPGDSFETTVAPGGGPCPASAAAAPNHPGFVAGTLNPQAGAYSPLAMKLSREDGSQNLAGFEVTLPPGLSARLAGVPYCSEAEIAKARARSHPNEGALEQADPSCPSTSQLGTLDVAAGAGPTPLHTAGHVYLAGPYKGAPLSAVAITPAVAGPFDLGAVVVRAPLHIDPVTAQARAVSDPLPTILDGIPLDLRSAALKLDRPNFTLNPTSCDPSSVLGSATSVFGQTAPLSSPFQVGGCSALPFKPKLHTRLFGPTHRGGHPRLRAVFEAKAGEANTARIVFALPSSEFIDQAHFRTICTRVQFAASQCPAGSVYGRIKAISPLLGYPLEGPIYLRSSSHELPDVVAALRGPPSQPIEVDLDGRVDSVNGGIRTTFEAVPDAPVTKAIVTLQGAAKGLFQNSTNICKGTHRANLTLIAHNGKVSRSRPKIKADCAKGAAKKEGGAHHR
jgi:hypothetical protein